MRTHYTSTIDLDELPSGTTSWFRLGPDKTDTGNAATVAIVRGNIPGPVGYIGAGTHGDELNSIEAVRRVATSLNPADVTGTVVLVVAHNSAAFDAHVRLHPADGANLDHCFPGDPNGSASQQLAHVLFTQLVAPAEYLLDLHCASRGGWNPLYAIVHGDTSQVTDESAELADVFGCHVILDVKAEEGLPLGESIGSALDHNLFVQSAKTGRPSAIVEFGGSAALCAGQIDIGVHGIHNVLRHRGHIAGLPSRQGSALRTDAALTIRTETGGFLHLHRRSGETVRRGEVVATVRPLRGATTRITSPADGVALRMAAEATVAPGDRVLTLAKPPC